MQHFSRFPVCILGDPVYRIGGLQIRNSPLRRKENFLNVLFS